MTKEATDLVRSALTLKKNQVGQPTDDYKNDPEGKPEGKLSKVMKGGAKLASKVTLMIMKNAGMSLHLWIIASL